MNSEALGRQIRVIAFIMIVFMLEMNTTVTLHAQRNTGIKDMASFLDRIREAVFVVGIVDPTTGVFQGIGTAWTLDRKHLATNAHVIEALEKMKLRKPGSRIVAKHGVFDRQEIVLGEMKIHPAYHRWNGRLRNMMNRMIEGVEKYKPVAVSDIGLLEVMAGNPGTPLQVLSSRHSPPALLNELFYVGYPTEDISGFATLRAVPVRVTAMTDFFFRPVQWRNGDLLHLSGPTTGGASGSPVFTYQGVVVGILSAADHIGVQSDRSGNRNEQHRLPVGFLYAQRVDLAIEVRDGGATRLQDKRDPDWKRIVRQQFMQAEDIIDLILRYEAQENGMNKNDWEVVTQQSWSFQTDPAAASRNRLNLRMDDGYIYLFIAVSEDGTDIDGRLWHRGDVLESDRATDHYPLMVYENNVVRSDAQFEVYAAEDLLAGDTEITVCVYRHAIRGRSSRSEQQQSESREEQVRRELLGEEIHQEVIATSRNGEYIHRVPLSVDRDYTYTVQAKSDAERDIDMAVRQGDRILDSDRANDHYPVNRFSRVAGDVEIALIIPADSRLGEEIELVVSRQTNERADQLEEGLALLQSLSNGEEITRDRFSVPRDGRMTHRFTVQTETGYGYYIQAKSSAERDIDLIARQYDRVITRDEANDHYPLIRIENRTGPVECEIVIPSNSRRGEQIEIVVMRVSQQ